MAYESVLAAGQAPDRGMVAACSRALHRKRLERERGKLQSAIEHAERDRDLGKVLELQKAKSKLDKELREVGKG